MTSLLTRSVFVVAVVVLLGGRASAAEDPKELMHRSDRRHRIPLEHMVATMTLQPKSGEQEHREYDSYAAQDGKAGDKSLIRFRAPADVKDTTLLAVEDPAKKEDDQWLYLPAFRKTRRVGNAELGDRFVGSDIFYEDMKRRYVDDYSYAMLREETIDGSPCWVIESKPAVEKVKKESPYAAAHIWLRKDILMAVKVRYFDRRMRPLKEMTLSQLKAVHGDAWRADRMEIVDVVRKHRTVIVVKQRQINPTLPSDVFSRHKLGAD